MSSTLSEGVRVPDIGSVNWGADVNFNWGLLNTALANISGNVKVDVANTWTAPQTFSETISGSIDGVAARAVNDEDGNNIKTALASKAADDQVVHLAGAETITGGKTFTGAVVTHNITPETDGTYALGTSNLRWQRINTGSIYNWGGYVFSTGITAAAQGTQSTALNYNILNAITSDSSPLSFCSQGLSLSNTLTQHSLNLRLFDSNGALVAAESLLYRLTSSGLSAYPLTSGQDNLGTSTNKWKTLNGINPGALSIPNVSSSSRLDISGNMVPDSYGNIIFTPQIYGWVYIDFNVASATITEGTVMCAQVKDSSVANSSFVVDFTRTEGSNHVFVWTPVWANMRLIIQINFSGFSVGKAYIYPCLGNV